MMKKLIFGAFLALGATMISQDVVAQSQENIDLTISNETSREQLWEMHETMKAEGIQFKYQPKFNQDRVLTGIAVQVKTDDGYEANFENLNLVDGAEIKIIRNFDENAEVPFCVGECATEE